MSLKSAGHGSLFQARLLLRPWQLLRGRSVQPFLSAFPESDAALLCHRTKPRQTPPMLRRAAAVAGSAGRRAGNRRKISAGFVPFHKLCPKATGSAMVTPAFGWRLSAAFDLS